MNYEDNNKKHKKFIRVKEATEIYSIGKSRLVEMAYEAKAIYKRNNIVLINVKIFDEYLESFRV